MHVAQTRSIRRVVETCNGRATVSTKGIQHAKNKSRYAASLKDAEKVESSISMPIV